MGPVPIASQYTTKPLVNAGLGSKVLLMTFERAAHLFQSAEQAVTAGTMRFVLSTAMASRVAYRAAPPPCVDKTASAGLRIT